MIRIVLLIILTLCGRVADSEARGSYELPPLAPPHAYGSITLAEKSVHAGMAPVRFSHWRHRLEVSCRVCHGELDFALKRGTTGISMTANRSGELCGACHNGSIAFAAADESSCRRCHDDRPGSEEALFNQTFNSRPFPSASFGNGIDWVKSIRRGLVAPAGYLVTPGSAMISNKTVVFPSRLGRVPPAIFPHVAHGDWVDCNMCHPEPFGMDGRSVALVSKRAILNGEYCGVCHLTVAFPLNDCERCHPQLAGQ